MRLAELYPQATVLANSTATARRVLAALDDSWLAHVAAHGTFRADNPFFSSLQLDDGPLTVYDIEGMNRAPYRLVLSACESGRAAPAGADELLGLASSLMPMGTAGIVAAVVPVSDRITPSVIDPCTGTWPAVRASPTRCSWHGPTRRRPVTRSHWPQRAPSSHWGCDHDGYRGQSRARDRLIGKIMVDPVLGWVRAAAAGDARPGRI